MAAAYTHGTDPYIFRRNFFGAGCGGAHAPSVRRLASGGRPLVVHTEVVQQSCCASGVPWLAPIDLSQQLRGVHLQGAGHVQELDYIESTFAALHLRDEALGASELRGECRLRETRGTTRVGQEAPEAGVLAGERRPGHPGSLLFDFGISQNRFTVGGGRDIRRLSDRHVEC